MASREKEKDRITLSVSEAYSRRGYSVFFIAMFVTVVGILGMSFIEQFSVVIIIILIIAFWALLFLQIDGAIWNTQGKELVQYNENGIFVSRKKLKNSNKYVPWRDIRKISVLNNGIRIFPLYDFAFTNRSDYIVYDDEVIGNFCTICIWTNKWKKIVLGMNLTEDQTRTLYAKITELKEQYTIKK